MDRFVGIINGKVILEMWVNRDDINWSNKWEAFSSKCYALGARPMCQ